MPIDHTYDDMDDNHNSRSWLSNGSVTVATIWMEERRTSTGCHGNENGTTATAVRIGVKLGQHMLYEFSLQCMAHTSPLQKYFLSNEYERDLNRDNPLGTGGELVTEFAQLWRKCVGTDRPPSIEASFLRIVLQS
jgi:ubiquitin carboxyl-terminal hydrolase 4/11/15